MLARHFGIYCQRKPQSITASNSSSSSDERIHSSRQSVLNRPSVFARHRCVGAFGNRVLESRPGRMN